MLYIKRVELKNIRCFEEFVLEFEKKNESCLIVGDNGEGKSTLLRSIAISLCDVSSASALFRELRGKFVRQKRNDGKSYIEVHLQDTFHREKNYIIRTNFHTIKRRVLERLSQEVWLKEGDKKKKEIKQAQFPWNRIFVVGYGAGGRVLGTESIESYAVIDGVYTLFRYDEPLQNPELALYRLKTEGEKRKIKGKKKDDIFKVSDNPSMEKNEEDVLELFLKLLKDILNLGKKDKLFLTKKGIEVRGPWGRSQLETLGDGYKSTVIWVLDFIGRRLMYGKTLDPKKMSGIVLLDEIEQHLHPNWQIKIMTLIREAFPKIQFITTTHSPLVVSGCKDCKIRKVSSSRDEIGNAYGWRAEDVYRNIMDIRSSRNPEVQGLIDLYRKLDLKNIERKITSEEKGELLKTKKELHERLHSSDPMLLSIELKNIKCMLDGKRG